MRNIDKELYQYILDHSSLITENWLNMREKQDGSIYSVNAAGGVEQQLRTQNTLTVTTVTSALLDDCAIFNESMVEWALIVAESRVKSDTPIYEVLEAMNKVREIYWKTIVTFINDMDKVTKEDIIRWNFVIHKAFDRLIGRFTELYYELTSMRLNAQQELINELSAPVIPLVDSIAVLPLTGDIDTHRAGRMLENVAEKCTAAEISHLFIDLSGVTIVDTMVAQQLYQVTKTLSLLGINSTISGIRPEVAQTSIQLGLDFSGISTHSTLKQALQRAGIKLLQY